MLRKKQEEKVARDSKTNPKAFWSFIKAKTNSRSGIADLKKPDGTKTANDLEKAELLNTFFQSVFTKEDEGPLPTPPSMDYKQELVDFVIEEEEVRKVLANLQVDKAPGPDGISPLILSQASYVLARPICIIFKRSLQSGEVPDEWRQAVVTPIYKKGCRSDASNYRPVSLTSIVCKCMERLVRDRIMAHLQANKLICKEQHGFVPRRSCCTQLLETLDEWTEIMDDGGSIDAIYTDFQKAFDTVPHRRLLLKLQAHGVSGRVLQWITSFLNDRHQKVVVSGVQSSEAAVISGIPQGSVLGPLLFVVFINDLPSCVESRVKMFADDTKVYTRSDSAGATEGLQEDINRLQQWSSDWLLRFHPQKCCVLKLGTKKSDAKYHMSTRDSNGTVHTIQLAESEAERDLGVMIDSKLSFKQQVSKSAAKANRTVGIIRRSFDYLTESTFVQLYKSLVCPVLEYGHCVWNPQSKLLCCELEDVQRRATKLLSWLKDKPYPERLRRLGLPCLEHRRSRGDMIEVYKYLHDSYDTQRPHFEHPSEQHSLRGHSLKLYKKSFRLNVRGHFFSNRVVTTWNSLPDNIVSAPSLNSFKSRLDSHWRSLPTLYDPTCYH